MFNEVVATLVPAPRSPRPTVYSHPRGLEHQSDATMRGYKSSENATSSIFKPHAPPLF